MASIRIQWCITFGTTITFVLWVSQEDCLPDGTITQKKAGSYFSTELSSAVTAVSASIKSVKDVFEICSTIIP